MVALFHTCTLEQALEQLLKLIHSAALLTTGELTGDRGDRLGLHVMSPSVITDWLARGYLNSYLNGFSPKTPGYVHQR